MSNELLLVIAGVLLLIAPELVRIVNLSINEKEV